MAHRPPDTEPAHWWKSPIAVHDSLGGRTPKEVFRLVRTRAHDLPIPYAPKHDEGTVFITLAMALMTSFGRLAFLINTLR